MLPFGVTHRNLAEILGIGKLESPAIALCMVVCVILHLVVVKYHLVTDRQADRQTEYRQLTTAYTALA